MPNKQLTAKVRLNTTQAEHAIDRLSKKIASINNAINRQTSSTQRMASQWQKVNSQVQQVANKSSRLASIYTNTTSKLGQIKTRVQEWWTRQKGVLSSTKSTNSLLGSIWTKLKGIAATYLGIMGAGAAIKVADTITSAENKLNYVGSQQVGSGAVNADGSYSPAVFQYTQDAMNKMYTSAQKIRMGYSDMMNNVSKSMVLAGDAFDNSIDNAIRFQEIMAKSYAIGGASAQEMSSSMYQMIQALGAGNLAGDELRSVREGAPLAYAAIEEFVQGVYNTEESLKDLASQGKVTANMVTAAILNAGNEIDSAFAQTAQTFAQTWTQIKNAAMKAFEPIAHKLRDALNKAIDNGLIEKISAIFNTISKVIQIAIDWVGSAINWMAEQWSWLQYVVLGVILLIVAHIIMWAMKVVATTLIKIAMYIMEYWWLLLIVAAVVLLIYIFMQWKNGAIDTCTAIVQAIAVIGIAILLVGLIMGSTTLMVIGLVLILLAVIFYFFEQVCGGVWVVVTFIGNLVQSLINFIMGCLAVLAAIIVNVIAFIVNLVAGCGQAIIAIATNAGAGIVNVATALWNVICAVCQNISIAFQNAWNGALSAFWNFIASCLEGLSFLEGPLNAVAELFGKGGISISGAAGDARAKASGYAQKDYVDIGTAWSTGIHTKDYSDIGDAWSKGWSTMDFTSLKDAWSIGSTIAGTGLSDWRWSDAYRTGASWGATIKDKINGWGSDKLGQINKALGKLGIGSGSDIFDLLGSLIKSGLGDSKSPYLDSKLPGGSRGSVPNYDDAIKNLLGDDLGDIAGSNRDTAKNTGSMADSMDLAEEDLSYLRDLAEREWKKEFTTASIKVDMNNVNTINNKGDLDGWVTLLTEKLYEELDAVADGVYA